MVISSFVNAPEMKSLRKFLLDLKLQISFWAKNLSKHSNSQQLLWMWAQSHIACCSGAILFLSNESEYWYYLSTAGALTTYSLMVCRHLYVLVNGFKQTDDGTPLSWVVYSENFTLCAMATLHLMTFPRAVKTMSFCVFSLLNLATFVVQKTASESWNKVLMPIIYQVEPTLLTVAVYADLVALIVYVYDFLLGQEKLLSAVVFAIFLLYRFEQSPVALSSVQLMLDRLLRLTEGFPSANKRVVAAKKCLAILLLPEPRSGTSSNETGSVHSRSRVASSVFRPVEIIKET